MFEGRFAGENEQNKSMENPKGAGNLKQSI